MSRLLTIGILVAISVSAAEAQISAVNRLSNVVASETFCSLICGSGGGGSTTNTDSEQTTGFGVFNQSVSGMAATQTSSFSSNSISVLSAADAGLAGTEFGLTSASSLFQLTFDLNASVTYELTGLLTENDVIEADGFDGGKSTVSLSGNGVNQMLASSYLGDVVLDENGLLGAGTYTLEVRSFGNGSTIEPSADTTADVTISFAIVPEPSTAVFLTMFGIAFAFMGRRRN